MAANVVDLDFIGNGNSNVSGDRSDDDAGNRKNQRDNDKEKLDPSIIENLLIYDSDDELTDHHAGADGTISQLIKTKKEARKSVWIAKDKAYLSGRLQCAALIKIALSEPLECEVILMSLVPMLWFIRSLERSISVAVSTTKHRAEAV